MPKKNWREGVYKLRKKYCDQVSLSDVVDYLPPVKPTVVKIKSDKYVPAQGELTTWINLHRHEQNGKLKEILNLEYKKIILVCRYTEQINTLAEKLKEYKDVYILNGATKDQGDTIRQAQESEECYFIVQAKMGEGWKGHMFDIMIFLSMEDSFVANYQMHERQRDLNNLRDIEIMYMVGGPWDQKILDAYNQGENFNPHKYKDNAKIRI
jgi:hypothetical protein